jgi:predicted hotdog family 3-hydroxylacyl-ACP dehydratase
MNLNRIDRFDILELIPQRAPFVMITELMDVREQSATSSFRILEDNIFVKDGQFQESGLIENIAQTAAAMSGYKAKKSGKAAEIGFLGGVKNLRIYYLPSVDTHLATEVTLENQVLNVNLLKGFIRQEDKLVAECEMKVFLID